MECNICGSQDFIEQDGYNYCSVCQTQSQHMGVRTEADTDVVYDQTLTHTREIRTKKRKRKDATKSALSSSILWSTTEAFDLILREQTRQISLMEEINLNDEFSRTVIEVWNKYLKISEIPFNENEASTDFKLHPASRFRDKQRYINKVSELPLFKNGTNVNASAYIRLGCDRVLRPVMDDTEDTADSVMTSNFSDTEDDSESDEHRYETKLIVRPLISPSVTFTKFKRNTTTCTVSEDYNEAYYEDDYEPKLSLQTATRKKAEKILSLQTRKILKRMLNTLDLSQSFDDFEDYVPEDSFDEESDSNDEYAKQSQQTLVTEKESHDEYDKQIMKHLTNTGKLITKYIPLSYLKQSRQICTNYFIDLMTLSKTLALINIALRLINCNVFTGDLIRWVNEFHVSYYNCLPILPEDWHITSQDFQTFTSSASPAPKTININTAKLAKHIGIEKLDKPDMKSLLTRFAKDLNLPKDIVAVILDRFDVYELFSAKLKMNMKTVKSIPFYDRWALVSIVMFLKRMFGLDGKTEYKLSETVRSDAQLADNVFIFSDWLKYTRHRFEMIKSYYTPLKGNYYEYLKDAEVFSARLAQTVDAQNARHIFSRRKCLPRDLETRKIISQACHEVACASKQSFPVEFPAASLYPLINATDFALTRARSADDRTQLSINFEDKDISYYITFRCDYHSLDIPNAKDSDISDNWPQNLKFLIELCCVILYCTQNDLYGIMKVMDRQLDLIN